MNLTDCFLPQCVGWRMGQEGNILPALFVFLGMIVLAGILNGVFSKWK